MARLGDLCKIYTGTGFPNQYQGEISGDYPFYKVGDISRNVSKGNVYLQECDNYISVDTAKKIKGTIVPVDTVVFAKIGEAVKLNRRAITSQSCLVDNNAMGICPDQRKLNLSYFFHYMCNIRLETFAEATTVPSVKKSIIENLDIPLPSYAEQVEISEVINKVSTLISLRKQQLAKLDELVKARFVELFVNTDDAVNWPQSSIQAVSTDMRTGPFGSALHHDEFVDSGVFVLGIDNAVENKFSYNRMRYITEEKYQQLKRYTVYPGDVIITIMGTVGRSAVIPDDIPKAINTKHLACITPNSKLIDSTFLASAFQMHPTIRVQLQNQCKGAIMDGLNLTIIKGLRFALPPIALQKQFCTFVQQTDKSKLTIQQILDKLETLKKSLMQKYFG